MTSAPVKTASPFAGMATALLRIPQEVIANATSEAAQSTAESIGKAGYHAGALYVSALQERAKTPERSEEWLHWSGVIGAIKRVIGDHAAGDPEARLRHARAL